MFSDIAIQRVIENEGGFQNLYEDRGNWTEGVVEKGQLKGTKYGISAMSYPDLDIRNLTQDHARAIYKHDWWDRYGLDEYENALAFQMLDAIINHGAKNANKILQRALGVKADGVIGTKTLKALNRADQDKLVFLFLAERLRFFTSIKTFHQFGRGWSNRIAHNIKIAVEDLDI